MNALLIVLVPMFLAIIALCVRGESRRNIRRTLLITGATVHVILTCSLYFYVPPSTLNGIIVVDTLGLLFLTITSFLFILVAVYSLSYFQYEQEITKDGLSHLYSPCMLFFLASMSLTTLTSHLGLLWVAIEATTLSTAPLIYYHHNEKALEATWKYLMICSVGIALALLGVFFIASSSRGTGADLYLASMIINAKALDPHWLRIGFIFILVGFGTKMGLAPLHNWLPDAHSEAPSPVSALLSGTLLNCAFLAILRFYQVCVSAGLNLFADRLLVIFGLASLFIAAVFITGQKDYKRLLAYSSVEHMGILALAVGVGAGFGGLLHAINHSVAKVLLFLTAGQILIAYRSKSAREVTGLLKTVPVTGALFLVGGLAIIGCFPFAPFLSEFLILKQGLINGHYAVMIGYLIFLGIIFVAMTKIFLHMVQGKKRELPADGKRPTLLMIVSPAFLAVIVLILGVYIPPPLRDFITKAALLLGGSQ